MNWEAIGAIGELLGAITVIATLIYLAIQVRQNTTSIQTAAYQQWAGMHGQVFSTFDDTNMNKVIFDGCLDSNNLTDENYGQFIAWIRRYMIMQQAQFYLYEKRVIEPELWENNLSDVVGVYRFPGVKQLWDAGLKTALNPRFVSVIENSNSFPVNVLWNREQGFHPSPYHEQKET